MLALGSLAFAAPWLLTALAALPVIWWLLRVTPRQLGYALQKNNIEVRKF